MQVGEGEQRKLRKTASLELQAALRPRSVANVGLQREVRPPAPQGGPEAALDVLESLPPAAQRKDSNYRVLVDILY